MVVDRVENNREQPLGAERLEPDLDLTGGNLVNQRPTFDEAGEFRTVEKDTLWRRQAVLSPSRTISLRNFFRDHSIMSIESSRSGFHQKMVWIE